MKKITLTLTIIYLTLSTAWSQTKSPLSSQAELKAYLNAQNFSGAVLAIDSESKAMSAATGFEDLEGSRTLDVNSKFKIASVTKLFTSVIIMQLIDEDKISLTTKIDDVLPEFGITNANKINIQNLLQHTSGLSNESKTSYLKSYKPDELINAFGTRKASFKPGKDLNYNNIDYTVLGKMIEKITGKSYLENLGERILSPLGMTNTGLLLEKRLPAEVSPSYEIKKGKKKAEFKIHIENFWAAGAMYSTVKDMLKFSNALKTDQLLSAQVREQLFTSKPSLGYVALGCWTFNSPFIGSKPKVMERRGGILGTTSVLMTSLDGPETLIVLSNTNGFNPDTFGQADNMKEYLFKTLFTVND